MAAPPPPMGVVMTDAQYELFIDCWLVAKSVDEVARTARISKRRVYRIARFLRSRRQAPEPAAVPS